MLRELRIQALSDAPAAFGSTLERELGRSPADWTRWLSTGATFLLEEGPVSKGLAAGVPDSTDGEVVHLMAMWLHPELRGSGAADLLVNAVLAWAAARGADRIRLDVVRGNQAATRLYERHGFQATGNTAVRARDGAVEIQMERVLGAFRRSSSGPGTIGATGSAPISSSGRPMQIVATGNEPLPLGAWAAVRLGLWFVGSQFLAAIVLAGVLFALHPLAIRHGPSLTADQLLGIVCIAIPLSGLVVLYRLRKNLRGGAWPAVLAALGWRPVPRSTLLLGASLGAVLAGFYTVVLVPRLVPFFPREATDLSRALEQASPLGHLIFNASAILIAPPVEEFVFRGILLAGFGTAWGVWTGVTATTGLFALLHLSQIGGFWPAFLAVIVMALVAAGLRLRSRSLAPGIAMHMAYNAVIVGASILGGT